MSVGLAGGARVAIAAVSIVLGSAACGSDEPAAERSDPVLDTVASDTTPTSLSSSTSHAMPAGSTTTAAVVEENNAPTTAASVISDSTTSVGTTSDRTTTVASKLGISEAEVAELEQQLDEIDRVLADIEAQLAQD